MPKFGQRIRRFVNDVAGYFTQRNEVLPYKSSAHDEEILILPPRVWSLFSSILLRSYAGQDAKSRELALKNIISYSIMTSVATVPTLVFSSLHMDAFMRVHGLTPTQIAEVQFLYVWWNVANDVLAGVWSESIMRKFRLSCVQYLKLLSIGWVLASCLPFLPFTLTTDSNREDIGSLTNPDGSVDANPNANPDSTKTSFWQYNVCIYAITIFVYDGCGSLIGIARNVVSNAIAESESKRVDLMRWNSIFGISEAVFTNVALILYNTHSTDSRNASSSGAPGEEQHSNHATINTTFQIYVIFLTAFCAWVSVYFSGKLDETSVLQKQMTEREITGDDDDNRNEELSPMTKAGDSSRGRHMEDDEVELESLVSKCASKNWVKIDDIMGNSQEDFSGQILNYPNLAANSYLAAVTSENRELPSIPEFIGRMSRNWWLYCACYALIEFQSQLIANFLLLGLEEKMGMPRLVATGLVGVVGGAAGTLRLSLSWVAEQIGVYKIVSTSLMLKVGFLVLIMLLAIFELPQTVYGNVKSVASTATPGGNSILNFEEEQEHTWGVVIAQYLINVLIVAHCTCVNIEQSYSNILLNNLIDEYNWQSFVESQPIGVTYGEESSQDMEKISQSGFANASDPSAVRERTELRRPERRDTSDNDLENNPFNGGDPLGNPVGDNVVRNRKLSKSSATDGPCGYFFSLAGCVVKPMQSVGSVLGAYWLAGSCSHSNFLMINLFACVAQVFIWQKYELHGKKLERMQNGG